MREKVIPRKRFIVCHKTNVKNEQLILDVCCHSISITTSHPPYYGKMLAQYILTVLLTEQIILIVLTAYEEKRERPQGVMNTV